MRKLILVFAVLLFCSIPSRAQDPGGRLEVFGGFSYGQWDTGEILSNKQHVSLAGWHAAPAINFNRFFGITADFSGYAGGFGIFTNDPDLGPLDRHVHSRVNTYMAGPEVGIRILHMRPFAHFLVGATRGLSFDKEQDQNGNIVRTEQKQTRLAYAVGGGLDWNLTRHVSLRAFQIDFFRNSFSNLDPNDPNGILTKAGRQNNARISAGIVIRLGVR